MGRRISLRSIIRAGVAAAAITASGAAVSATSAHAAASYVKGDPTGTVSVEDGDAAIAYTTGWSRSFDLFSSAASIATTVKAGASASYTFVGTNVVWIGQTNVFSGRAEVFVDGTSKGTVELYSVLPTFGKALWNSGTLAPGVHTVTIKATGKKHLLSFGTKINLDRVRTTTAPRPVIGFSFDTEQFPDLTPSGLRGTVTCSRPVPVTLAYTVTQGAVSQVGTATVACTGTTAVTGLPFDPAGLAGGAATVTATATWTELGQTGTNSPVTQPINLNFATVIGLTLDSSGFIGVDQTFVGGTVTCNRAVLVNLTATLPSTAISTPQQVSCPASGAVAFLLDWPEGTPSGVVSITAQAVTADGGAGASTTQDVVIP